MTRSRYRVLGTDARYFLTLTINDWLPVLTRPETVAVLYDGWRYLREHHAFALKGVRDPGEPSPIPHFRESGSWSFPGWGYQAGGW